MGICQNYELDDFVVYVHALNDCILDGFEFQGAEKLAAWNNREEITTMTDTNTTKDLIGRLREGPIREGEGPGGIELFDIDDVREPMFEAADALEALQARVEELEGILHVLALLSEESGDVVNGFRTRELILQARTALAPEPEQEKTDAG